MNYQERLRNLAELKRKYINNLENAKKQKTAKRREKIQIYLPQIEKVCKSFAEATGWQYEESEGDISEIHIMSCFIKSDRPYKYKQWITYEIALREDLILIYKWRNYSGPGRNWADYDARVIDFAEFSEDKLTRMLEDWIKEDFL